MLRLSSACVRSCTLTPAGISSSSRLSASSSTSRLSPVVFTRANSTLPIINDYVRRTYPFPTVLESNIPPDYSRYLYYYQQHPHDLPTYKSKLTVDIRDLGLDPTSRMVLREIVGNRYNAKTHTVSFVSRNLSTAAANENRVFQMLDACLVECRTIAKKMNGEGFHARDGGAEHDRLLKPVPSLKAAQNKVSKQQAAAIAQEGSAPAPASVPKPVENQLSAQALEMPIRKAAKEPTKPAKQAAKPAKEAAKPAKEAKQAAKPAKKEAAAKPAKAASTKAAKSS